jgi:DNA-binding response OmpR family regulator
VAILAVDDDPASLDWIAATLRPFGHAVLRAESGADAIALCRETLPSLVLLDVRMPGLDGFETLRVLRGLESPTTLPIVLVTGVSDRGARARGLELGANDFLEKPLDATLLHARVRTLLVTREASLALRKRHEELERLQRFQREMIEFVVHDLKTPIAVIRTNLGWARDTLVAEAGAANEALDEAELATGRVLALASDLVTVSRLETQTLSPTMEDVALLPLLEEAAAACRPEAALRGARVRVEGGVQESTPSARVDRTLMRRVFENLVDEALRVTDPNGEIVLVTRACEARVCHTPRAAQRALQESLFREWERGEERASPRNLGLRMYYCRRVLEAHGARLELLSDERFATQFVVRFA